MYLFVEDAKNKQVNKQTRVGNMFSEELCMHEDIDLNSYSSAEGNYLRSYLNRFFE